MANYSDNDLRTAQQIINAFLGGEKGFAEIPEQLAVEDIETETKEFLSDIELLEEIKAPALVLRMENKMLIPVALALYFGPHWPMFQSGRPAPLFFREWLYEFRLNLTQPNAGRLGAFETISLDEARFSFRSLAGQFLATRIASVREFGNASLQMLHRAGNAHRVSTPGCNFTVSSNSNGLRVFWAGAFRLSGNYFGSPTTPVTSVLQSGTYVFGVDGGAYGSAIQWDTSAVAVLPGTPSVHLNY